MATRKIKNDVYAIGAIDWDRTLFDEIIPLPDGTSYNSYLVKGSEKTALLDTVDPDKVDELIGNLKEIGVKHIDYIVSHHAEQDHSGSIPKILELYPEAKVVTNKKCKDLEKNLLLIDDEKFITINNGETLSLGNKTLEFVFTPWVHWPETMSTYLREDKILFTCDFFGSHIASSDLFVSNNAKIVEDAKRYYAEIMMPFRPSIRSNLKKLENLDIDFIAPSHGQVYDHPDLIINAYKEWVSENVKNKVVIPYVSMHGSTEKIVNYLVDELMKRDISVRPFNLITADIGEIAMALVDAATIVVASPTVLTGLHPVAAYIISFVNAIRPKVKFASFIGSFGWAGKRSVEQFESLTSNLKAKLLEPILVKGYPKVDDFKSLDRLADEIFKEHQECKFIK